MTKIVAIDPILLFPEHIKILNNLGKFKTFDSVPKNENELLDRISDSDIVINFWTPFPKSIIEKLTLTKMICSAAAGYDWIDIQAATHKKITVTHCPGHNAQAVAEHTIGLILAVARQIALSAIDTKKGQFNPTGYQGIELKGKTLGIIGFGSIGKTVAQIAKNGFGMHIVFTNSSSSKGDLEKLLQISDFISVNAPLNNQTRSMLGEKEFSLMKDGVVFVNTGRGGIINEEALVQALKNKKMFAVGLDTLTNEPFDKNHPLFEFSNVIITPHTAWNTQETDYRLSQQVTQIVTSYLKGKPIYVIPEQRRASEQSIH